MTIEGMQSVECGCGKEFFTDDPTQTLCRECLGKVGYVRNGEYVMPESDNGG